MTNNLKFDVAQLEPEVIDYEKNIRSHYGKPPHAALLSELGIVSRWIEQEISNKTDPVTLGHKIGADDIMTEVQICVSKIKELHDQVVASFASVGSFEASNLEEATNLGSRLIHYDYRIRRIDTSEFSPEQQQMCGQAQRDGMVARSILVGVVVYLSRPQPNESASSTRTSSTHNTTGTTSRDDNQSNQAGSVDQRLPEHGHGQPLNSTGIEQPNDTPAFEVTHGDQPPYNAVVDVQKRLDAEAARRMTEYQICSGRIAELHEDVRTEYCMSISPRRPIKFCVLNFFKSQKISTIFYNLLNLNKKL